MLHANKPEISNSAPSIGTSYSKAILDSLTENVAVLDGQGMITAVNEAWLWFVADNDDPMICAHGVDSSIFDIVRGIEAVGGEPQVSHAAQIRALLSGTQAEFMVEYMAGDASWQRWFQLRITPMSARPEGAALVAHREITAQKYAESQRDQAMEALRQSEVRYRRLFEAAKDGILILDAAEGTIVDANPYVLAMLEYTLEELIGAELYQIGFFEDADANRKAVTELQETGYLRYDDMPLLSKGGRPHQVEVVSNVYPEGPRSVIQCNIREITERVRVEKRAVEAQKMEMVGQLAAGIAHDFNNLMTTVIGYSEMISGEMAQSDPRQVGLRQINKAGTRAASLTQQLLAFSRKQLLEHVAMNLNAVVKRCSGLMRGLLGEHTELVLALDSDLGWVHSDPAQVEQVLLNLAVNARDAMPKGGKLRIETVNFEADPEFVAEHGEVQEGPYVMLAMSDTGCGMSEETQGRLFEPFYTTKPVGKGSGLGLAMVDGFIRQSGGFITVESQIGAGSTFRVFLPQASASETPPQEPVTIQPFPRGTETILLVEDEEGVRMITQKILESCGYTVLTAADGASGVSLAREHTGALDLLLSDVILPGISGVQLAEQILALRPEIKCLFMSGYTPDALLSSALKESEMNFVQKPYNAAGLAGKVRQVLDQSRRARQIIF